MSRTNLLLLASAFAIVGGVAFLLSPLVASSNSTAGSKGAETSDAPDDLAFTDGSNDGLAEDSEGIEETERGARRASERRGVDETAAGSADEPTGTGGTAGGATGPALDLPVESFVAMVLGDGIEPSAEPGSPGTGLWFPNPTQFGGERAFLVVDQTSNPDYVKVSLPVKPNGQHGWLPRSEVEIRPVRHRAVINLTDDSVTVWDGDRVIVDTKAVTGKPETPTPVGTFYVRDIIEQADPTGMYGPHIVALSGFSEVLDTFNGALPALAIHGTDRPEQIGSERSAGCIRIPNDLITVVADSVPLGTPVTIVA